MMQTLSVVVIVTLAIIANINGDHDKLEYTVLSASGVDIQHADIIPMPIINPGEAFLTFKAYLKRPIQKIRVVLKIVRTVAGIALPIKCYKVDGVSVGSCDYEDLCLVLKSLLPSFKPETCPPSMLQYNINCNCPFNIPVGQLDIIKERLELPDAHASIANFMAVGTFSIQIDAFDSGPYASIIIKFTVKAAKSSG
ncbi:unnamed protein product [Adineta steineri]|uniref:Ganglioside GM2 activator-like protein n=1 Tax=Adineta steineri TaxID=433720 RepID=A0A814RC47_9BILA|nr:unnamed protein product [Adineta steineri]